MRVAITDSEYGDDAVERPLIEGAGHSLEVLNATSEEALLRDARGFDALLVQYAPITRRVLEGLPGLKVVARYGTGVDNIDVAAAEDLGVAVRNIPVYGSDEVAQHALTLARALVRGLAEASDARRDAIWPPRDASMPQHPRDLTLGVVGLGRIGRRLLELATPFFGAVRWFDPVLAPAVDEPPGRAASILDLARSANLLSVHVPLTPATTGIVGGEVILALQEPRYLINVARGGICAEDDVVRALEAGWLRGYGADVFEHEPLTAESRLLSAPRVLATPHTAWASPGALVSVRSLAAQYAIDELARDGARSAGAAR